MQTDPQGANRPTRCKQSIQGTIRLYKVQTDPLGANRPTRCKQSTQVETLKPRFQSTQGKITQTSHGTSCMKGSIQSAHMLQAAHVKITQTTHNTSCPRQNQAKCVATVDKAKSHRPHMVQAAHVKITQTTHATDCSCQNQAKCVATVDTRQSQTDHTWYKPLKSKSHRPLYASCRMIAGTQA